MIRPDRILSLLASTLSLSALAMRALPARAEVCPVGVGIGSCHTIHPTDEISSQGDISAPFPGAAHYVWNEASISIPPPASGTIATEPGLEMRLGAGGWGENSREPMAIAQASFSYTTPDGVQWLNPTSASKWYEWPCTPGTVLCHREMGNVDVRYYIWTSARSTIRWAYRVVQVNPGTLPTSVKQVPLKIDYRMGVHIRGLREDSDGVGLAPGLDASAHVLFTDSSGNTKGVMCPLTKDGLKCITYLKNEPVPSGAYTASGSFDFPAGLKVLEKLVLVLNASVHVPNSATCRERQTSQGPTCLNAPWAASGHAVADPYVYIDPAWEYASWFKVEMAADETDTAWVTPTRSPIDTETLMPLGDGGVASGDDAGAAQPGDGGSDGQVDGGAVGGDGDVSASGDGDGDTTGDGDGPTIDLDGGTQGKGKKGGDGCQLAAGTTSGAVGGLSSLLLALVLLRRRRA